MATPYAPPSDVSSVIARIVRPRRAVVTAGMPYANGPVHLGHLAGAHLPADIHARWMSMLIGRDNVLFVCGTDEHGSTSELSALKAGVSVREFVDGVHDQQAVTLNRFHIDLDVYAGTSRPDTFPAHRDRCQDFLRRLHANGLLEKRSSRQWYDSKVERFLPDRFVRGKCPNPRCDNTEAYSDECDRCGSQHEATALLNPRSSVSDATPELRDTIHWYLNMASLSDTLRTWLQGKQKTWRPAVLADALDRVQPAIRFDGEHEAAFKALKATLPKHRSKYAPGKQVIVQFERREDLESARSLLAAQGIPTTIEDAWGHRAITRDIAWGVPVPEIDADLAGKTLYVWPDSLIAPISFCETALRAKGKNSASLDDFWRDPDARIYQFLGQDNVFFYVLMQGALWLGTQDNPHTLPTRGDLQLTEVFGCAHLMVNGEKMSKSLGNFFTGDQLLDEMGYTPDQVRYYLALLGLADKSSDFDLATFADRNRFLSGPMNAAFERPISAVHTKFEGRVPEGKLLEPVPAETVKIVQRYVKCMERADYPNLLFEIERYARTINSLFTQHKPHDDRYPEEMRRDALYTSFYVLKTLMIMLQPFVPETMERLRVSLRLPENVFRVEELGTPIEAGHIIGTKDVYFPEVSEATKE
jgi:methionyl-tRNA synthetase